MRRDPAFLEDMVLSADKIRDICAGGDLGTLMANDVSQAAILHHLAVIGEAANQVSSDLRSRHPEIPWSRIVSQRNRVVHDYFGIDWTILWKTIREDLPRLRGHVSQILNTEFPPESNQEL